MAPDTKPGRGEKPKSPEKKIAPAVKPELPKKPGTQGKKSATTKR